MRVIYDTNHYLFTLKTDIFVLNIIHHKRWTEERDIPEDTVLGLPAWRGKQCYFEYDEQCVTNHLQWFVDKNVQVQQTLTCGSTMFGNLQYWVDFKDSNDPNLLDYCQEFENVDGKSKEPEKYQMHCLSYDAWVKTGEREKHEQHLKDLQDPNYNW